MAGERQGVSDIAGWQRIGWLSTLAVVLVGICYLIVIVLWMLIEQSPAEPIADPWLAVMEVLTILSALAITGMCRGVQGLVNTDRCRHARVMMTSAVVATVLTVSVHIVQLTVIRLLWLAGSLPDYRLVWPSVIFAFEYLAWDLFFGLTLVFAGISLSPSPGARLTARVFYLAGVLCIAGLAGPLSGRMWIQNIAVFGYTILLPLAALLLLRYSPLRTQDE